MPPYLLYKFLTGGQGDGYARIHGHLDIGQDNRYEHEVTPLGGTRMRIPVSGTQAALQRSAAWTYTTVCVQWACLHAQIHFHRAGQQV